MSQRWINGQMTEIPDHNTQAVLDSLHGSPQPPAAVTVAIAATAVQHVPGQFVRIVTGEGREMLIWDEPGVTVTRRDA